MKLNKYPEAPEIFKKYFGKHVSLNRFYDGIVCGYLKGSNGIVLLNNSNPWYTEKELHRNIYIDKKYRGGKYIYTTLIQNITIL